MPLCSTFAVCFGARAAPLSASLSALGLRAAPLLHLRCPLWGFALAPLLVPSSSNHGAKIGRIFIDSKFFAVNWGQNACEFSQFRTDPRWRPLKRQRKPQLPACRVQFCLGLLADGAPAGTTAPTQTPGQPPMSRRSMTISPHQPRSPRLTAPGAGAQVDAHILSGFSFEGAAYVLLGSHQQR